MDEISGPIKIVADASNSSYGSVADSGTTTRTTKGGRAPTSSDFPIRYCRASFSNVETFEIRSTFHGVDSDA